MAFVRTGRGEAQLINTIQDLAAGLDKSTQIDAILLDFSKAFDKVAHQRLLRKLHHYGVRASTLRWIQSFLGDRTKRVVVDGESSATAPVTSGVPPRNCPRTTPIPCVYQRPTEQGQGHREALRWWLPPVQNSEFIRWCGLPPAGPRQPPGMGACMADALQPRQMWGDSYNKEEE